MKRVTLYDVRLDEKDAEYLRRLIPAGSNGYVTRQEMQDRMNELQKQKKEYEQRNRMFVADEIRKAWLN